MEEILSQLEHLFVQSIPTVVFVFLLLVILDRIFFQPVTAILKKREEATTGALARAREQAAAVETKSREYEAAFQAARQEVYRQREAARRVNLAEHENTLKRARAQSEAMLDEAQKKLTAEVGSVKGELEGPCRALGREIAEAILGTSAPPSERGGLRS